MGKVWAIHTQTKKPKNQKTKKPKNQKTRKPKNQKNKIAHPKGRGSDAECWVLSFCFFCFFCGFLFFFGFWFFGFGFSFFCFFGFLVSWFFVFLVCVWMAQTLPMGLNCFFVFFCVLEVLAKLQKPWKNKKTLKNTKSSDPCPLPGLSPDLAHGSELFFVFFCFFHCCFECFSCEDAFITVPLKKMRVSTICTPAPHRPNCKKIHGKNQNSFNDLYND